MSEKQYFNHILPLVRKPGRYVGGELHSVCKGWDSVDVRFVLIFPDLYEIGMSHYGLQILYHILNSRAATLADRCYAPDTDLEEVLRESCLPLVSIEARRPLADFDVIGITLPYELCYTNILTILDLAGLPLRAAGRKENDPLVIGGGTCAMNPEPVADFFDAIVLGDGEEVILDVAEAVRRGKKENRTRAEIIGDLSCIQGVYIPSYFEPRYLGSDFAGVLPLKEHYLSVRRRVLAGLPDAETAAAPLVPVVKPVHDRLGVEIARGCTRGCRFCQAGIIYRPVRERQLGEILAAVDKNIVDCGYEELALLSLSTGDYTCLPELMTRLMDRFADQYVSVSMPSMRVGTLTPEIMNQIRRVRKTGFTVAPEAGTDRMREVINKGISEVDLLDTCRNAFGLGWNLIKFYFMIGLPTETWEDIDAIVELAAKARKEAGPDQKKVQINVSVGTFVPKPHTPFQWERQLSLAESMERIDRLKARLPRRGFKLKWHDPRQSMMEGVFSRGDRRLSVLIETAWQAGVRLDGWSEHYRLENWQQAAKQCGIHLDAYLEARDRDMPLPWDHLDPGVDRRFLEREMEKALQREYTPDCRANGCQKCGLCDFKTLKPVLCSPGTTLEPRSNCISGLQKPVGGDHPVIAYRVHYTRLEDSRWYSHLETLQLIFRALRRTGISLMHSQGFNPTPKVAFGAALPVGMESEAEYFDMEVHAPVGDPASFLERLSRELPPGMQATGIEHKPAKNPEAVLTFYEVVLDDAPDKELQGNIDRFLNRDTHVIERIRKNKRRELDIRPLVHSLVIEGERLLFELISYQSRAGASPREILREAAGLSDRQALLARVRKAKVVGHTANT